LLGKLEGDIQRFGGIFKVKKETTKQCIFLKLTLMGPFPLPGRYLPVGNSIAANAPVANNRPAPNIHFFREKLKAERTKEGD
jgi:hypothetical protein